MGGFPEPEPGGGDSRLRGVLVSSAVRRLAASCGLLVAAALITCAGPASAAVTPAFWVSLTGAPTGTNISCKTAAYDSVQSAVTAAEAYETSHAGVIPRVDICPGTYSEQVTILKSLVLTRAPVPAYLGAATIVLPASVGGNQSTGLSATNCQADDSAESIQDPQSVIEICAAGPGGSNTTGVSVAISGLTVEGNWPTSVCYDSLYDILAEGGATLSLTGSTVEKAGAYPLNGCQGGVGVEAGFAPTGQAGRAFLSNDTIETYQKNGITVDGPGSYASIVHVVVAGAGPTPSIAQNGIQLSNGATGSVTSSTITGNNYTGQGGASSTGILAYGGCGSPLVKQARFISNKLTGNDIGIGLYNYDATCTKSAAVPTLDVACLNRIENSHGYPGGVASPDANLTGFGSPAIGYQAGVADVGYHDLICDNAISGAGYAPRGATSSLPNPPPPAFVRPVDIVTGPAIDPQTGGNTFDGFAYHPA